MDEARFRAGALSTGYIAETFPDGFHGVAPTPFQIDLMTAAACAMQRVQSRRNGRYHAVLKATKARDEWVAVLAGQRRPGAAGGCWSMNC